MTTFRGWSVRSDCKHPNLFVINPHYHSEGRLIGDYSTGDISAILTSARLGIFNQVNWWNPFSLVERKTIYMYSVCSSDSKKVPLGDITQWHCCISIQIMMGWCLFFGSCKVYIEMLKISACTIWLPRPFAVVIYCLRRHDNDIYYSRLCLFVQILFARTLHSILWDFEHMESHDPWIIFYIFALFIFICKLLGFSNVGYCMNLTPRITHRKF